MAKPFPVLGPNRKWVMDDQRIRNRLMKDIDDGLVTLDLGKDNVFYLFKAKIRKSIRLKRKSSSE